MIATIAELFTSDPSDPSDHVETRLNVRTAMLASFAKVSAGTNVPAAAYISQMTW